MFNKPTHAQSLAGRTSLAIALGAALFSTACSDGGNDTLASLDAVDRAYYILPPGNYGGIPFNDNSRDQLPLYDGLTPLRGNVTDQDIEDLFLPQDFEPIGETFEEATGRPGVTIIYDEFGIPHITGETRADLAFGAGWVTIRDRRFLLELGRYPARVAVADVPNIDAFDLLLEAQQFVPSEATEQLVTDQVQLIIDTYGEEGEEIIADAQAYADGINAWYDANGGTNQPPITVNDIVAVTAFIGSIFGAGGGSEQRNAEFLSELEYALGDGVGQQAWEDAMLFNDPEAPTTIDTTFDYGPMTGGEVTGSVTIDRDSIESLDPLEPIPGLASTAIPEGILLAATDPMPDQQASNWLIVDDGQSENRTRLAVMGPQLGYYYPEIVQQIHLTGPGIEAQGAAVPGLAMYILIGRTPDYAWSLTSANHDVRDVYAEILCEPDGSEPTRESLHYEYEGECIAFEIFDAGTLNGTPVVYPVSVHGPMFGTATSNGQPVALTRKRSTFGRDGLNLAALKDMTEGDATTPERFFEAANKFGFTFNWGYMSRRANAYFSSGYLPVRAEGLDRRLPTLGTGDYEWQGFLTEEQHPHAQGGPDGRLLNWNNQSAPGFMHGDSTLFGSVHRVEGFDKFPAQVDLAGVVGIMNRAATEDDRSTIWPVVSEVLRGSPPPTQLAGEVADILDAWVAEDAPRLDGDNDGNHDEPGPAVYDAVFEPMVGAALRPVFGDALDALDNIANLGGNSGGSLVDKDLRTLLGQEVEGPFNLSYCGGGDLDTCRDSLWQVLEDAGQALVAEYGADSSQWLSEGQRQSFAPGILPDTMRATNRPTYQQVLELTP